MDGTTMISIILPVYNGQRLLRETLESVLDQTYTSFEVVAIDDGSTDNSLEVLRAYENDIVVHSQKNCGVAATRNSGVQLARGDLIAFLDQDDIWYPFKLEKQIELFQSSTDVSFVYSDFDLIDSQSRITQKCALSIMKADWMRPFIGGHLHPYPSTVLMKKSLFMDVGGFDPEFIENTDEDIDLWVRVYDKVPFHFIPEALVQYRRDHQHQMKKRRSFEVESANFLHLYQKLESRFRNDSSKKEAMDGLQAVVLAGKGKAFAFHGEFKQARDCFKKALELAPDNRRHKWRYLRTFLPVCFHRYIFPRK
ncbi:glycosyltransferase [Thermodesulfobacteriota bacterium]